MTATAPVIRPLTEPFSGERPRRIQVSEVAAGDRVVYRLRGRAVSEVVASVAPLRVPAGYVAVRFVGRHFDVHYPVHAYLQVASSQAVR